METISMPMDIEVSHGGGSSGIESYPPPPLTNDVTVSPDDAKVFTIDTFYTYSGNKKGEYYLCCSKDQNNWANLIYADKNVTIKGTYTYYSSYKYNISLKAGWNYLYQTDDGTYTSSVSTSIPEYYKWRVLKVY
jgi:hypothetical protein